MNAGCREGAGWWMNAGCCVGVGCRINAGCCVGAGCRMNAGCCESVVYRLDTAVMWLLILGKFSKSLQNRDLGYFETKFILAERRWRREKFCLLATFRKVRKRECLTLTALQISFKTKIYRHTTWPSWNQWERLHVNSMWPAMFQQFLLLLLFVQFQSLQLSFIPTIVAATMSATLFHLVWSPQVS